jgi:hypothetical protein
MRFIPSGYLRLNVCQNNQIMTFIPDLAASCFSVGSFKSSRHSASQSALSVWYNPTPSWYSQLCAVSSQPYPLLAWIVWCATLSWAAIALTVFLGRRGFVRTTQNMSESYQTLFHNLVYINPCNIYVINRYQTNPDWYQMSGIIRTLHLPTNTFRPMQIHKINSNFQKIKIGIFY